MLRVLLAALALCVGAVLLLLVLVLDTSPSVVGPAHLDAVRAARARALLHDYDPRQLRDGEERTLSLSREELGLVLDHLARRLPGGAADVALGPGRLEARLSTRLPPLPGSYLNLKLVLAGTGRLPSVTEFRIGSLTLPSALASRLVSRAMAAAYARAGLGEPGSLMREVSFTADRLVLRYEWQSHIADALRAQIISPAQQARIRDFNAALVTQCARHERTVRLPELAAPLFAQAALRSAAGGDPQAENEAVLLVLTHYVSGRSLALLLPDAAQWPQPASLTVRLQGRADLVRHFLISALLAATGGNALADTVGTAKELDDSRRGSGFSFVDLLADEAGTLFGQRAVASAVTAVALQTQAAAALSDDDWLPALAGLPERLSAAEFARRYGEVGSPAYQTTLADLRQRLSALPLYR